MRGRSPAFGLLLKSPDVFRRLKQFLPAIWLTPFLLITGFWVRSHWKRDHVRFTWKGQVWELKSATERFSIDNQPEITAQESTVQSDMDGVRKSLLPIVREAGKADVAMQSQVAERDRLKPLLMKQFAKNQQLTPEQSHDIAEEFLQNSQQLTLAIDAQTNIDDERFKLDNVLQFRFPLVIGLKGRTQSVSLPRPWLLAVVSLILPMLRYRRASPPVA